MLRLCVLSALLAQPAAGVYGSPPCDSDEVQAEVQGASGTICVPHCSSVGFSCPASPSIAQATCMLQDVDHASFCGLFCDAHGECPGASECRQVSQPQVSLCLHPSSFMDWATLGSSARKMTIDWPSAGVPGKPAADFLVAKAGRALDNLKFAHGLDDSDADILVLKDFLSSVQQGMGAGTSGVNQAGPGLPSLAPALGLQPVGMLPSAPTLAAAPRTQHTNAWRHDMRYIEHALSDPIPGLEHGVQDTIWNIENIQHHGAATELVRGLIWIGGAYLIIGAVYNYQAKGASGWQLVPNLEFWMEYPGLVADGITYSKLLLGSATGNDWGRASGDGSSGGVRGGHGAFETL